MQFLASPSNQAYGNSPDREQGGQEGPAKEGEGQTEALAAQQCKHL